MLGVLGEKLVHVLKCSNCGKDVKPQAINCGACGHSLLGQAIHSEQPGWRSLMAIEIPRVRVRGSIFQGFRRNPNSFTASTLAIAVFVLLLIEWVYPTRLITPGYALLLGVITVGLGMLLAGPRGWGIACLVLGGLLVATSILPFAVEVRTPHVHEPISPPSGFGFEMVKGANPAIHEYRATAYDGRPDAADQAEPRVMAYYLTELQSAGWKLVNHSAIAGYHRADFTKTGRGSIEVIVHEGFPNSGHHVLTLILDVEAVSCAGRTCVVPE